MPPAPTCAVAPNSDIMLSSPTPVTPRPASPPAAPAGPGHPAAGGPSFAQFMSEQAAPAPAAGDAEGETPEPATAPGQPARRASLQAKPSGPPRAADGAAKVAKEADKALAPTADAEALAGSKAGAVDDTPTDEDLAAPAELQEFTQLIGLTSPAATALQAAASTQAGNARTPQTPGNVDTPPAPPRHRTAGLDAAGRTGDTGATSQAKAGDRADDEAAMTGTALLQAPATATQEAAQVRATETSALPSFAAAMAQAQLPAAAADIPPTSAEATLQAPLHSDAFAPELGARVSLMAADGVQTAELQLNPAEMGPVAVQIVMDGAQAQVSFHAVQAETRQALEQCMPDLAAALQAQGLTLSGGGVFQQSGRESGAGSTPSRGDGTGRAGRDAPDRVGGGATGGPGAPARRTVGLLDTFA